MENQSCLAWSGAGFGDRCTIRTLSVAMDPLASLFDFKLPLYLQLYVPDCSKLSFHVDLNVRALIALIYADLTV